MDEISTAATYDIVKSHRSMAKSLTKTIVIALLHPSPKVFDQFDDVMIMNEGSTTALTARFPPQQHQNVVHGAANIPRNPSDYAALF
ncbi:Aste57867_1229 [Aphanomyces stellatus]|uniref:Aste57867_1229 protein n=1 Tax=Aphanomyces stellatus TaxID=120398 RepID=A0A485K9S8_9STRA|nr:hypothetical protein As57867_001228 [Aphanomyces stellatus]VFT78449.1 Aste57867_1229 [Aphanomyces stellatus]